MASKRTNFHVTFGITAVLLAAIVFFLNGVLANFNLGRFDFTQDGLYTVSDAARDQLAELDVPVQIKYYVTARDALPTQLQTLERDVVDKLSEFQVASGGNLSFRVIDPSDDPELQEMLGAKGIQPFQVQTLERDAMGIKVVWSALSIAYKDKDEEILPQVLPQSLPTFEYDVCSSIAKLTRDSEPVIAIYASKQAIDPQMAQMYLQMGQPAPQPQEIYGQVQQLLSREGYVVRPTEVSAESPIPEDATALLLLAPRSFTPEQREQVDAFVQRGGNLLVAIQNLEYQYSPGRTGGFTFSARQMASGLEPLLANWGLEVGSDFFFDRQMETLSIPRTQTVGGLRFQVADPVQVPMQIGLGPGEMDSENPITSQLGQVLYLWGNRLVLNESRLSEESLATTTLLNSSDVAWEVDYQPGPIGSALMNPGGQQLSPHAPLAVLVEGDFPSPNDGRLSSASGDTLHDLPNSSRVMLIGCGKMFEDSMLGAGGNGLFLLNVVDALALGDALIGIRAKAYTQRLIDQPGEKAKLLWRFFAVGLVPLLVAVFGITRALNRRRRQADWLRAHA